MKKILLMLLLFPGISLWAQNNVERTYISTDRDVYVSGDQIWLSAFCMNASEGFKLSKLSAIAYVEVVSTEGTLESGKIALVDGRGAGRITIPASAPTGNYRIIAYTRHNRNEEGFSPDAHTSKTISIFNPFSNARVKDGVEVVTNENYNAAAKEEKVALTSLEGGISITCRRNGDNLEIDLKNATGQMADCSISVARRDGIESPAGTGIKEYIGKNSGAASVKTGRAFQPEYEGEIISAKMAGTTAEEAAQLEGHTAFISVPTDKTDLYSAEVKGDGTMSFVTNNIYGTKEMICEVEDNCLSRCHMEIIEPFVAPQIQDIPKLRLSESLAADIQRRGMAMQVAKRFAYDTLVTMMPIRENPLILANDAVEYRLDDYKRFPVMKELFIEFIKEVKVRREEGEEKLKVKSYLEERMTAFGKQNSLIMVDGVPIFDHKQIIYYDPLLIESIIVYPYKYYTGWYAFCGMANFVTYKRNLQGIKFNDGVRVIQYKGCSYPEAFTCSELNNPVSEFNYNNTPDFRELLYWHPKRELPAGEDSTLKVKVPAGSKSLEVVVEGLTGEGNPIALRMPVAM